MCVYVYVCVSVREREINRLYLRFDAIISIDILAPLKLACR